MVLSLTRSGGLLGSPLPPVVLDTANLSTAERKRIEGLVLESDFFDLPKRSGSDGLQRDRFQYELEVKDESGKTHHATFGETNVSEPLSQLVRAVQQSQRR